MTRPLKLSLLLGADYDRTRALCNGTVKAEGVDLAIDIIDSPHDAFAEILASDRYDGGEMSFSFHSTLLSKFGDQHEFVGLPVFLSRMFRHGNILVNTHAGITEAKQLEGRIVGIPEYGVTMGVWIRGILMHEYGVRPEKIHWRTGRPPAALAPEVVRYPEGLDIQRDGDQYAHVQMLSEGKLDAYVGPVPTKMPPNVRRLFPDYGRLERAYYRKTGIFPIMHFLVLRRRVLRDNPWLAASLYRAFCAARDQALEILSTSSVLKVTLPWLLTAVEEQTEAMGGDIWSYGFRQNRATIAAFLDYAHEQGLLWRKLAPEEMCMDEAS